MQVASKHLAVESLFSTIPNKEQGKKKKEVKSYKLWPASRTDYLCQSWQEGWTLSVVSHDSLQGLVHRFTSAFEETKRELEVLTSDLDASISVQLAAKLSAEELPQKLQEASLVSRATLQAHMKQVRLVSPCQTTFKQTVQHCSICADCTAVLGRGIAVSPAGWEVHFRTMLFCDHLVFVVVHNERHVKTLAVLHKLAYWHVLSHVMMS